MGRSCSSAATSTSASGALIRYTKASGRGGACAAWSRALECKASHQDRASASVMLSNSTTHSIERPSSSPERTIRMVSSVGADSPGSGCTTGSAAAVAPGPVRAAVVTPTSRHAPGDRLCLPGVGPEGVFSLGHSELGEGGEIAVRLDLIPDQHSVPDLAGRLPGVATDLAGGEVERAVGDARVDVHTAVVLLGVGVVVHVARLR